MPAALPDPVADAAFYDGVPLRRLLAFLIDAALIFGLAVIVIGVLTILTLGLALPLAGLLSLLIAFGYRWVTLAAHSATLGMAFLGIELRNRAGGRLTSGEAAVHTGLFLMLMASILGWIATVLAILATERGQGIPDLLLGTVAINRPAE